MKLTNKEKKQIESILNKYKKILLLDMYVIKLKEGTKSADAVAECKFTYPYLNPTININVELFRERHRNAESLSLYFIR